MSDIGTSTGFCYELADVMQFVGMILLVFKIVIPILLIILGMFDLGKAVISSDDKAVASSVKKLAFRLIAAVIVFFIPTIISAIFTLVEAFNSNEIQDEYKVCKVCLTDPRSDECSGNIDSNTNNTNDEG